MANNAWMPIFLSVSKHLEIKKMHRGGVTFGLLLACVTGFFRALTNIFHISCITNEQFLEILTLDMDIASGISCILFNSQLVYLVPSHMVVNYRYDRHNRPNYEEKYQKFRVNNLVLTVKLLMQGFGGLTWYWWRKGHRVKWNRSPWMWGLKTEKASPKWEDIGVKENLKTNIGGVDWDGQDIGREWIRSPSREDGQGQRLARELESES